MLRRGTHANPDFSGVNNSGKVHINWGHGGLPYGREPPAGTPEHAEWKREVKGFTNAAKQKILNRTFARLNSKGKNQAIRNVYESKTGQSATPGTGPANLIRAFTGVQVPRGAEGGKRKTRKMRKSRSKKTRKYRK